MRGVIQQAAVPTVRVVDVDDWIWQMRITYGTIMVDAERCELLDILPDRTARR